MNDIGKQRLDGKPNSDGRQTLIDTGKDSVKETKNLNDNENPTDKDDGRKSMKDSGKQIINESGKPKLN